MDNMPLHYKIERIGGQKFSLEIQVIANDGLSPDTFTAYIALDFNEEGLISIPVIYQMTVEFSTFKAPRRESN
jgi:hypothetical protein